MQKILIMTTKNDNLRSEAIGWTAEDGVEVIEAASRYNVETGKIDIGYVRNYQGYGAYPETPLHAIGMGWKLMVPPIKMVLEKYEWWFSKD